MSDILLVGQDLPDCLDFAEGFVPGRRVFTSVKNGADTANFESEGIFCGNWNRPSAISARSFILNAETKFNGIESALVYFDSRYFSQQFELDRTEDIAEAVDQMISGYLYFINELIFRLDQRKDPFILGFLVRTSPSRYENLLSGGKNTNIHPVSNVVAAAQNMFTTMAENIATQVADKNYLSVLLSRCDNTNELYNSPKNLSKWISESFETIKTAKSRQTPKQAATWVKAGGKIPLGFSLFK